MLRPTLSRGSLRGDQTKSEVAKHIEHALLCVQRVATVSGGRTSFASNSWLRSMFGFAWSQSNPAPPQQSSEYCQTNTLHGSCTFGLIFASCHSSDPAQP